MGKVNYETDTPVQGEYREHVFSAMEKVQKWHEEQREQMTEQEKLIDERSFNYGFEVGESVILDSENITIKDNDFTPKREKFIGKVGIVKKCYSDLHAFGRGDSYMIDVQFEDELVKDVAAFYLIKYV